MTSPNTLEARLRWCVLERPLRNGFEYTAEARKEKQGQWPGNARVVALTLERRAAELLADALGRDATGG
jgi:hypothetical protein